ncbi:hypothetical protein F2Q70_00026200 [Brassica cretica]|nr:hypothetical protein F2Q70_00026200 [Brassica cretica]
MLTGRGERAFVDTLMMHQIDPRSVNGGPSMHLNSRCIFLKHIRDIDPCILSMAEYLELKKFKDAWLDDSSNM